MDREKANLMLSAAQDHDRIRPERGCGKAQPQLQWIRAAAWLCYNRAPVGFINNETGFEPAMEVFVERAYAPGKGLKKTDPIS